MASELEKEFKETMSDAFNYVQPRVESIKKHLSELERLKQQLLMTPYSDTPKQIREFDRNVHMMVLKVNECLRQSDLTLTNLQRLDKQLTESKTTNGISFGIGLSLAITNVVLLMIDQYYGISGLGLTAVGLLWYVHSRRSTQEARAQLQLAITTKCNDNDQSKCQKEKYITDVRLKVEELHKNKIQVKGVPTYD